MELIRLENITKAYRLGEIDVPVLRDVSLSIARGEMVALMGASGSGKTTLMNILGCLDRPTSGKYWLDGQEMSLLTPNQRALVRAAKLGFVFQNFNLLPRTTASQNVVMPLDYVAHRPGAKQAHRLAGNLLARVGLAARSDHEPSQLSGGQQQRVAIARALVNRPVMLLADEPTGNLDSHTSVEILRMFQELNAAGLTVLLVTHDPKVAAYAHRTIRIADGLIEGDETCGSFARREPSSVAYGGTASGSASADDDPAALVPQGARPAAAARGIVAERGDARQGRRKLRRGGRNHRGGDRAAAPRHAAALAAVPATLRTSLRSLGRNKMRSALTALGVIIGVAAVIAMTEIGQGSKVAMQRTIAGMGSNVLVIVPGAAMTGSVNFGAGTIQTLHPGDMDEILRQCMAVSEITPVVGARAQLIYGRRNWVPMNIVGTAPAYFSIRNWENIEEGEIFTERDVRNCSQVCLIGETIKEALFPDESPVGKEIRIRNVPFYVLGVLAPKGANMVGQDQDDIVLAPWTSIKFRVNAGGAGSVQAAAIQTPATTINTLNNLYPAALSIYPAAAPLQAADTPQSARLANVDAFVAKAASPEEIPQAIDEITGLLRERHHLAPDRDNDFEIRDITEILKMSASASELMGALLLVVATISLIVGGVGIMNIMLVSVTERTREIGLRMAVGARSHHILRQFLFEAVLLCLAGGVIGILLGRGASMAVHSIKHWPIVPSVAAIVVAVTVSAGVGIVFGFYPAWKASRLDPIVALRYE